MKLSIVEPLGISEEKAAELLQNIVGDGVEMTYYNSAPESVAETIKRTAGADIVMLANMPYREDVLSTAPGLKLLSVAFTGIDHVDYAYAKAHGVTICNCAGYSNEAVSELTIGLALSLYRKIGAADIAVRAGHTRAGLVGLELSGKAFGVIGTGAIGQKTIALARAFGCTVYAYSRTERAIEGVTYLPLKELMAKSDIISLHVPLTDATRGLIGADEIALMKDSAILINTARGPIVDYRALAAALKAGRIAGAGIDVFEGEPPIAPDHPLFSAPNVVALPHVGFATHEALEKRAVIAFTNIRRWLDGTPQNVM